MKTFISFLALGILTISMAACGGSESNPRTMALEFAEAFANGNFDRCNSLMTEYNQDEFTPEKNMSAIEKAALSQVRENSKKMKYRFTVIEDESFVEDGYACFYMTVTSEADPEFKKYVNVDLDKDSDTGRWGVESYSRIFNDLIGF